MSYAFQLSDEQYTKLAAYAAQHEQTPEILFEKWVTEVTHDMEVFTSSHRIEETSWEAQEEHAKQSQNHPLLQVAGIFALGEPGWADNHDEYLAEAYGEDHANE